MYLTWRYRYITLDSGTDMEIQVPYMEIQVPDMGIQVMTRRYRYLAWRCRSLHGDASTDM